MRDHFETESYDVSRVVIAPRGGLLHESDLGQLVEDRESLFAALTRQDAPDGILDALQTPKRNCDEEMSDEIPPGSATLVERAVRNAASTEEFTGRNELLLTPCTFETTQARVFISSYLLQRHNLDIFSANVMALPHQRTESQHFPLG